jgi:hypothetical protein
MTTETRADDQEQVNKPASNVKCEQTKAPTHSEDNGHDQEHRIELQVVFLIGAAPQARSVSERRWRADVANVAAARPSAAPPHAHVLITVGRLPSYF